MKGKISLAHSFGRLSVTSAGHDMDRTQQQSMCRASNQRAGPIPVFIMTTLQEPLLKGTKQPKSFPLDSPPNACS